MRKKKLSEEFAQLEELAKRNNQYKDYYHSEKDDRKFYISFDESAKVDEFTAAASEILLPNKEKKWDVSVLQPRKRRRSGGSSYNDVTSTISSTTF